MAVNILSNQRWNLINCVQSSTEIICNKCGKAQSYGGDSDEAVDAIIKDGWYATTHQNVYCKSCNAKRVNKK